MLARFWPRAFPREAPLHSLATESYSIVTHLHTQFSVRYQPSKFHPVYYHHLTCLNFWIRLLPKNPDFFQGTCVLSFLMQPLPPPNRTENGGRLANPPRPRPTVKSDSAGPLGNTTDSTQQDLREDQSEAPPTSKKRKHRGGRRKRNRRQSFAAPSEASDAMNPPAGRSNHDLLNVPRPSAPQPPFYRLGQSGGRNLSNTSLESEALLDHRYDAFTDLEHLLHKG